MHSATALCDVSKATGYKSNFLHTRTTCTSKPAGKVCEKCRTKGSVSSACTIRLEHNRCIDAHDTQTKHDIAKNNNNQPCRKAERRTDQSQAQIWLMAQASGSVLAWIGIGSIRHVFWSDTQTFHGVDVRGWSTDHVLSADQGSSDIIHINLRSENMSDLILSQQFTREYCSWYQYSFYQRDLTNTSTDVFYIKCQYWPWCLHFPECSFLTFSTCFLCCCCNIVFSLSMYMDWQNTDFQLIVGHSSP